MVKNNYWEARERYDSKPSYEKKNEKVTVDKNVSRLLIHIVKT